jgi:hypothetical protein
VGHAQRHPDFGQEALEPVRIALDVTRQELQGDRLTEFEIVGPIHFAHAAASNEAKHPVAGADHGAGQEPVRSR